jgi:hypothetical protein
LYSLLGRSPPSSNGRSGVQLWQRGDSKVAEVGYHDRRTAGDSSSRKPRGEAHKGASQQVISKSLPLGSDRCQEGMPISLIHTGAVPFRCK